MALRMVVEVAELLVERRELGHRIATGLCGEDLVDRQAQGSGDDRVAGGIAAGEATHDPVGDPVIGCAADPMDEDVGNEEAGDERREQGPWSEPKAVPLEPLQRVDPRR